MKHSYLALLSGLILLVILGMSWCRRSPVSPTTSPTIASPAASATPSLTPSPVPASSPIPTPTPTPTATTSPALPIPPPLATPSAELKKAGAKTSPAVILVTTFDPSGKLLRTGTAFFATSDGRLVTNWHSVQDAAYGVEKSPDGKIRNILGVVAAAPALDLAVLKAETKTGVPFIRIGKAPEPNSNVAIVGSSAGQREEPIAAILVTGRESSAGADSISTGTPLTADTSGRPLVDANGEVVGIVALSTAAGQAPQPIVRPPEAVTSLLSQTRADSSARWPTGPNESATPTPTATPKGKIIVSPAPLYPDRARSAKPPLQGSGRFRIVFDAAGQVKTVQIIRSTGQPLLDQAAVEGFQKWKSTPGHEWSVVIPITFRP